MKALQAVQQEINSWPRSLFPKSIRFGRLSLELTKKCTNKCDHCANWGTPQDSRMMDTQLVLRLIREAKEQGLGTIHLWGGEPFLHPDLNAIIAAVFSNNLNLMITANGFWGKTIAEATAKLAGINGMRPEKLYFQLIVSCDGFHQSQPSTPIENIANILKAVIGINDDHLVTLVHSCNLAVDRTLDELFPLLAPQITLNPQELEGLNTGYSVCLYDKLIHIINGPVDLSVGRAKTIAPAHRGSKPLEKDELFCNPSPIVDDTLYVDVEGDVFIDSHNIGDKIFPVDNITNKSLADTIATANQDLTIITLHTLPFKYFLFPFRKYLDLDRLLTQSHSPYELFNRLCLAEATQDKSTELQSARAKLLSANPLNSEDLLTIRQYGDLTDRAALVQIFTDKKRSMAGRWDAAFVFLAISIDGGGFFAYSCHRPYSSPFAPITHFYHGKDGIQDMGTCQIPKWYETYKY